MKMKQLVALVTLTCMASWGANALQRALTSTTSSTTTVPNTIETNHSHTTSSSSTIPPISTPSSPIVFQFEGKLSSGHVVKSNYLKKPTYAELFEKIAADLGISPHDFAITLDNNHKVSYKPNNATIPDISQSTFGGRISFKSDMVAKKVVAALQQNNNRSNSVSTSSPVATPNSSSSTIPSTSSTPGSSLPKNTTSTSTASRSNTSDTVEREYQLMVFSSYKQSYISVTATATIGDLFKAIARATGLRTNQFYLEPEFTKSWENLTNPKEIQIKDTSYQEQPLVDFFGPYKGVRVRFEPNVAIQQKEAFAKLLASGAFTLNAISTSSPIATPSSSSSSTIPPTSSALPFGLPQNTTSTSTASHSNSRYTAEDKINIRFPHLPRTPSYAPSITTTTTIGDLFSAIAHAIGASTDQFYLLVGDNKTIKDTDDQTQKLLQLQSLDSAYEDMKVLFRKDITSQQREAFGKSLSRGEGLTLR